MERTHYGLNFSRFRAAIYQDLKKKNLDARQRSENWSRTSMLHGSYLQLKAVGQALKEYRQYIEQLPSWFGNPFAFFNQQTPEELNSKRPAGTFAENRKGQLVYTMNSKLPEKWEPISEFALRQRLSRLFSSQKEALWDNVLLEGRGSSAGLKMIELQMQVERNALAAHKKYSMQVLPAISDYRVMLGIQYLIRLARECGISSRLDPVLSFPLGSNVISLLEAVGMYETLVTGKNYSVHLPTHENEKETEKETFKKQDGLAVIEQIVGTDGEIIYARETAATPVVDQKTSNEINSILHNVVRYGTGRYALKNVRLESKDDERNAKLQQLNLSLPLMGKTGTANDFRNATFLGYVPTKTEQEGGLLLTEGGYTVGVYVGFDDNDPMKKGTTHISGSQGALPTWCKIAEALYSLEGVADHLDPVDLAFDGIALKYPDTGQYFIPVQHENGGIRSERRAGERTVITPNAPVVLGHGAAGKTGLTMERRFIPFWLNQQP